MSGKHPTPLILAILDGFGIAPEHEGNAIRRAETPVFDRLLRTYPVMTLRAAGEAVGLAWGEMGNSEVGHLSIGSGRVFYQNRPRIDQEIATGAFFENAAFRKAAAHVRKQGSTLHLIGLVSPGGVHSHQDHLSALLEFAKRERLANVAIHAILDGRDAISNSGIGFIRKLETRCRALGVGRIASLSGRYYAMDRDNRWDRIAKAYAVIVRGEGPMAADAVPAIAASYGKGVYDEEFIPTVITHRGAPVGRIHQGDAIISFNFRADRARQFTHAVVDTTCVQFSRGEQLHNLAFVTMMEYEKGLPVDVAFPPESITTCLAKEWSQRHLRQLHIAETEKYAHVTFFFNGMREEPYPGEERILLPSPKVATYDEAPAMSARAITDRVIREVHRGAYDAVVLNIANPDMVGHTGKLRPTIEAIEVVDACLGELEAAVVAAGGVLAITADHGNAEELLNLQTHAMDKEHATNPVPFILCGKPFEGKVNEDLRAVEWDLSLLSPVGMLADVAPTVLAIMELPVPSAMTGRPLV